MQPIRDPILPIEPREENKMEQPITLAEQAKKMKEHADRLHALSDTDKQEENRRRFAEVLQAQGDIDQQEREVSPEWQHVRDLEAALLVYDVTLACLLSYNKPPDIFVGQCKAAVEAYSHATGEISMAAMHLQDE